MSPSDKYRYLVTRVHAFRTHLISRSEAKHLLAGLGSFEEVAIDFLGVEEIGQGFADEVFRVWARKHPKVRLKPVNMSEAVEFMVRRATP